MTIVIPNAVLAAYRPYVQLLHVATSAHHVSNDKVDWRRNHAIIVDDALWYSTAHGSAASHTQ